jgi:hypothetical protein
LEWLHQGCASDLSADFPTSGAGDVPYKFLCQNRLLFALAPRPSFGAAISGIVVRKGLCV